MGVIPMNNITTLHYIFNGIIKIIMNFSDLTDSLTDLVSIFGQSTINLSFQQNALILGLKVVGDDGLFVFGVEGTKLDLDVELYWFIEVEVERV
jgi:hypothetical protein